MADIPRDPVTGRFTRVNVERDALAPDLGVPREYAYGLERRDAPAGDDLGQGGQRSPLRARNAALVHPDDAAHHNAILRTAARGAGLMDPTPALVGLEVHGTPVTGAPKITDGRASAVVYGDGGRTMSPTRAEDIDPRRR